MKGGPHIARWWLVLLGCVWINGSPATAASFDCAKARTSHEKHICTTPALSKADSLLGEAFQSAARGFPIKGFVRATQQVFLQQYEGCDTKDREACGKLIADRIDVLKAMSGAAVYYKGKSSESYDPEAGVFWVVDDGVAPKLMMFGGWMPDMNKPRPFPDGFICDEVVTLKKTATGYEASEALSDEKERVKITGEELTTPIVSCSARNGLEPGPYRRIRGPGAPQ